MRIWKTEYFKQNLNENTMWTDNNQNEHTNVDRDKISLSPLDPFTVGYQITVTYRLLDKVKVFVLVVEVLLQVGHEVSLGDHNYKIQSQIPDKNLFYSLKLFLVRCKGAMFRIRNFNIKIWILILRLNLRNFTQILSLLQIVKKEFWIFV